MNCPPMSSWFLLAFFVQLSLYTHSFTHPLKREFTERGTDLADRISLCWLGHQAYHIAPVKLWLSFIFLKKINIDKTHIP